jgi:hypothetical protein
MTPPEHCAEYRCRMGKTTRGYIEEMGQTGAGIERADDIDTTVTNSFTTKWRMYAPGNVALHAYSLHREDRQGMPLVL